jgi:hypothetical protein
MTTVYELTPPEPPTRSDEPPIIVRAERGGVVIQPHPGHLDAGATAALVAAINAAVAAGAAVLVDLVGGPAGQLDGAATAPPCGHDRWPSPVATVAGPGFVELAAGDRPWLLDVIGQRLSRSHAGDRRFLPVSAWTPVVAVTVSAAVVGATTASGDRIAAYRAI